MEASEISRLLDTQTQGAVKRFKESAIKPENSAGLLQAFDEIVGLYTIDAHPRPVTTIIEEPSTSGILPPGAKKEFVRTVLSGQQPPPLKVQDVEVPTTDEEKFVDALTVHIIDIADPYSKSDSRTIKQFVQTIESLKQHIGSGTLRIEPPNSYSQVPINVQRVNAVLHLVVKSATGNVSVLDLSLKTPADYEKCLKEYEQALQRTTSFDPLAEPTQGQFADKVVGQKLAQALKKDEGPGKLVIPIFPSLRQEETYWGSRSGIGSNLAFNAVGERNFLAQIAGEPLILKYDQFGREPDAIKQNGD